MLLKGEIIMEMAKEFVKGFIESKMREALSNCYISVLAIKNASIGTLKETTGMSDEEARTFVNNLDEEIFLEVSKATQMKAKEEPREES